jgi:hypothetical protein
VKRIWFNGQLVYNADRFAKDDVLKLSDDFENHFQVHTGSTSQGVSSIIEAHEGASTPAYRGYSYIVFNDVLLERFGNRFPNVEVEVVQEGSGFLPIYEVETSLHIIIGRMLRDIGFTESQFDVSQLTDKVLGYADQQQGPVAQKIQNLADCYLFDVVETNGILKFVKQPAPIVRREHNENCLINEDGLLVNAMHTVEGRGGYFHPASGTSEGQFTAIKACVQAYKVAQTPQEKAAWRDRARFMAGTLEDILYRKVVPETPSLWVPHWLFSVKQPFQLQSWRRDRLYFSTTDASSSTKLRTYLPTGSQGYGNNYGPDDPRTKIKKVFRVYANENAYMLWDNPYSEIVGPSESGMRWGRDADTNRTWVEINKVTARKDRHGNLVDGPRNAVVIYSIQAGPMLGVSEGYEAWPHWRALEPGEIDCATDTLYWALDAYKELAWLEGQEGNTLDRAKWLDAEAATEFSIVTTHKLEDSRDFFRPQPNSDAFSISGTFESSTRTGMSKANWQRNANTGIIVGNIPANSVLQNGTATEQPTYERDADGNPVAIPIGSTARYEEMQFGRGVNDRWRAAENGRVEDSLELQIGASILAPKELYVYIDTQIKFSTATRYFARINMVGGTDDDVETIVLKRGHFTRMYYGGDAATTDPVGGDVVPTANITGVSLIAGASKGTYEVRATTNNEGLAYINVYSPTGQDLGQMTWVATNQNEGTGYYEFNGPQIKFKLQQTNGESGSGWTSGSVLVNRVVAPNGGPPGSVEVFDSNTLPADATIKAIGFSYMGKEAMKFYIKRVRPIPPIILPYAPYVSPYTVNLMGGQMIDWRGSPGSGYTFPHGWVQIGNATGARVNLEFLRDAQDEWVKHRQAWNANPDNPTNLSTARGPFMPAFVWDRADAEVLADPNTWTFNWHDPNSQWGGYKYRPLESVCRTYHITTNSTVKTLAGDIADDFMSWLDPRWPMGSGPPTDYPEDRDPFIGYPEPHFAAYCMRAAMWLLLEGDPTGVAPSILRKAWTFLKLRYKHDPMGTGEYGPMHGSWPNEKAGAGPWDVRNPDDWEWFGFWHMEIIESIALMLGEGASILPQLQDATAADTMRSMLAGSNIFLDRWTRKLTRIDEEDMGAAHEGQEVSAHYMQIRGQEIELPLEVQVKYADPDLAYSTDIRYARRLNTKTKQVKVYDFPIALSAPQAELLASRLLYINWMRQTSWTFTLPYKYFAFDPGDVITPTINGKERAVFITKATYGGAVMEIAGYNHDPEVYRETALVSARSAPRLPELVLPGDTTLYMLDLPLLKAENIDQPGYYYAASGNKVWRTGIAQRSVDGRNWETVGTFNTYSTMGQVVGAPGDGSIAIFDDRSSIAVLLLKGLLESCTDDQLLVGKNLCLVGNELIQFGKAEKNSDGVYILSHLLRGRKGTEWATKGHTAGERFVMLDASVLRYSDAIQNINRPTYWRGVTAHQHPDDARWQEYRNSGRALRPYSPVDIRGVRDASQNLTLTWKRRSRVPSEWTNGNETWAAIAARHVLEPKGTPIPENLTLDPPLAEAFERYEIDFVDATGVVKATYVVNGARTFTWTAAEQTAKFGAIQFWARPRIFQMSAVVGRGYAGVPRDGGV